MHRFCDKSPVSANHNFLKMTAFERAAVAFILRPYSTFSSMLKGT
jgi:hypothetical protein